LVFSSLYSCSKVALVLGGGGARASFQVGVIEGMCQGAQRNTWDMIVGSSTGAINGAILAQFNKNEQCTSGLRALKSFWDGIKSENDYYESHSFFTLGKCLNTINFLSIAKGWFDKGGMCSNDSGKKRFSDNFSATRLRASNVDFHFISTSLADTETPVWFTKTSTNVLDLVVASAAIALLLPPLEVNGMYYMDGGAFVEVPLNKAIDLGATRVLSIINSPFLQGMNMKGDIDAAERDEKIGPFAFEYIFNVIHRHLLIASDLRHACLKRRNAVITGVFPSQTIGECLDYNTGHTRAETAHGLSRFRATGFVDLCTTPGISPSSFAKDSSLGMDEDMSKESSSTSSDNDNNDIGQSVFIPIVICFVGSLIGGIIAFIVFERKVKSKKTTFTPIPTQKIHPLKKKKKK